MDDFPGAQCQGNEAGRDDAEGAAVSGIGFPSKGRRHVPVGTGHQVPHCEQRWPGKLCVLVRTCALSQ